MMKILLIEDDKDDASLLKEAFNEVRTPITLEILDDGEKAISHLCPRARRDKSERPDLILLDLNLPKVGGLEVLSAIKKDADASVVPVIVMTTSNAAKDILESYRRHANSYIVKPMDFDQLIGIVRSIEDFWLNRAALPSHQ